MNNKKKELGFLECFCLRKNNAINSLFEVENFLKKFHKATDVITLIKIMKH